MSVIKVKTQTRFMVLFTYGSLLTWGKSWDASPGISPRYLPVIYSQLIISLPLLQTSHHDRLCLFLTKSRLMEKRYGSNVGGINICPSLHRFQIPSLSQAELSSLDGLKAWGKRQTSHHDITFLLVLAREETTGDRKYGLSTTWVNPSQARVPSMEEVVRN